MEKLLDKIKEYGGIGFVIGAAIISAAISYGANTATASLNVASHEVRIVSLEKDNRDNSLAIAKMEQKIDDLWHDAGHN